MNNHPERMILIAVGIAAVLGIIGSAVSCSMLASTANTLQQQAASGAYDFLDGPYADPFFGDDTDLWGDPIEDYTEADVPASMDIPDEEARDDLEAVISADLEIFDMDSSTAGGSSSSSSEGDAAGSQATATSVKVTKVVRNETTAPRLSDNQVLSETKGTATLEYNGETFDVGFTSYYYCDDPRADDKIWFIYAYDLDSYEKFPKGFDIIAGDPIGVRDWILSDVSANANSANLAEDPRHSVKDA